MQILVLHSDPKKAARKLQNRKLPQKLFVELLQLLSTALRVHGVDHPLLMKTHNPKHPCALWVTASKAHFLWAFEHAYELHEIYKRYCKVKKTDHKSLPLLRYIGELTKSLPCSMPDVVSADTFYNILESSRASQSKKQRLISGEILRAYQGLPKGCSSVALAIASEYQKNSVCYGLDGRLNGIDTYLQYHKLKHPLANKSDCPWLESD